MSPIQRLVGAAVVGAGLALIAFAVKADRSWFSRHVLLPFFFIEPRGLVVAVRAGAVVAAAALFVAARAIVRLGPKPGPSRRGRAGAVVVALVAALPAAEGVLRLQALAAERRRPSRFELRVGDRHPRYGWAARPFQNRIDHAGAQEFPYVTGSAGLRVRAQRDEIDPRRPTLVVAGESIAAGYGLPYDDTFAARAALALGAQALILAEGGYGPDQAFLRVNEVLPRLERPIAVVTIFVPCQLGRTMRDDRPRLVLADDGELAFVPEATGFWRSLQLRRRLVDDLPYATEAALTRSIALTRAVFVATAAAARARDARPLFVVPLQGRRSPLEDHPEDFVVRSLLIDPGLPFLVVDLDDSDVIPHDGHPNARGAARIAEAIVAALARPLD
jgi:hypothetical protein